MKTSMKTITVLALAGAAALSLSACSPATPAAKAFEACKKYVELGYASNDDVSEYCMETSKGSGETADVDSLRQVIVEHNQLRMDDPDYEQIEVDF